MTDDTVQQQWGELRWALIQQIRKRIKAMPEDQRTLWDVSSEGCGDGFTEVMSFVDAMFGVKPLDWLQVQIQLEDGP